MNKQKFLTLKSSQRIGKKFIKNCTGSRLQNGVVHNSIVSFFNYSVKITEKLWNKVLKCKPGIDLSDEKRIDVPSVLQKLLLKKQRANFFGPPVI